MYRFCRNAIVFLMIIFLIFFISGIVIRGNETLLRMTYFDELYARKDRFQLFTKENKTINLVTGSSHSKDFFDVNLFGKNWFTYANGAQYLQLSLVQLEAITKSGIKIDTLLMTMDIFDLAPLPSEVRFNYLLYKNIYSSTGKLTAVNSFFEMPFDCFTGDLKLIKRVMRTAGAKVDKTKADRLDKMQSNGLLPKDDAPFFDARKTISYETMDRFALYDELVAYTKKNNIKLILVVTPKSKSFFSVIKKENYKTWRTFVQDFSMKYKEVVVLDYEKAKMVDSLYVDLDHPQSYLRNEFTKTISDTLKTLKQNHFN